MVLFILLAVKDSEVIVFLTFIMVCTCTCNFYFQKTLKIFFFSFHILMHQSSLFMFVHKSRIQLPHFLCMRNLNCWSCCQRNIIPYFLGLDTPGFPFLCWFVVKVFIFNHHNISSCYCHVSNIFGLNCNCF